MSNIEIERYGPDDETEWNEFVASARNSTFMFDRSYMDYHSDVFTDHSLLVRYKAELLAVLPASIDGGTLTTHGGLTFGGFLINDKMKAQKMLDIFGAVRAYAAPEGIERLVYKCIPHIYHSTPSSEDRYALYRNDASLIGREISSAVKLANHPTFQTNRQRGIDDATEAGVTVRESEDFETYWDILKINLAEKHGEEPVHTLDEIELLQDRFPDNIRLFGSFLDDEMIGGVVVYESSNVARAQYIANSDTGRNIGGLDIVFDYLINKEYTDISYLDLGVSTEERGEYLNDGLIFFKEGFGARGVVHDFYEVRFDE